MGNSVAKKRSRLGRLSTYELTRINEALDGLSNTDVSNGLNAEIIQTLWKYELVPSLLQQYSKFLFPNANSKCSVEEFAQLYVQLTRGDYAERAETIALILGKEEDSSVDYDKLIKYVTDLTESYLLGIEKRKTREILSWHLRTNGIKEENLLLVAKWWCHNLQVDEENQVSMDSFERWLSSCGVLATIHREKLAVLFGLEPDEEDIGMLPLLMNPEAVGANKSILDPVHILYLNFLLPTDYQQEWRFLFSTSTHGESFSMLLGKIMEKGPTVIVISDEFNHVFGGFASQSWTLSPKFQGDEKCFLFSLLPEVRIFHPTGYNDHYMYLNYHQQSMPNGLGMGGQFDYFGFWLDAEFGVGKCSDVCTTFRKYKLLSAKKTFNVRHLEIWGVGPAPLTAEEKGERPGILEKDPTARKILEMAGKPQHSAGMRENSTS